MSIFFGSKHPAGEAFLHGVLIVIFFGEENM